MPELPEVEVSRRQLERWTAGQVVREVLVPDAAVVRTGLSSKPSDALPDGVERVRRLVGQASSRLVRYGKRLGWAFGDHALLAHFGMTGHWVRRDPRAAAPDFARIGLRFDPVTVWYADSRRFGCVVPIDAGELDDTIRESCGPDALDEPLDGDGLRERVSSRKAVKVALMEQDRLAGLGNIHTIEACFRAKLAPSLRADRLTGDQWSALADAIGLQLRSAVEAEDREDDLVYVNLGGPNPFAIYSRDGEACPVCATAITSGDLGGRTTYWCPTCQALPDESVGE